MKQNVSVHAVLQDVERLWQQGARVEALGRLKAAYEQLPSDARLAFEYGHALGQLSSGIPSEEKSQWRAEGIEVLSRLCANMQSLPADDQWKILRHFYLYSGQHLQNRALGYQEIERGNPLGVLSVGFGCLYHAVKLADAQQREEAYRFAIEAREAFQKLRRLDAPKPGRLLALALTQALLGCHEEALHTTGEATRLFKVVPEELREHERDLERFLRLNLKS